jgi:hypothetical protein
MSDDWDEDDWDEEEVAIVRAVGDAFGAPTDFIAVGSHKGSPGREVIVHVGCPWWWRGRFKRRHAEMVEAVRKIVGNDSRIRVELARPQVVAESEAP